MTWGSLTVQREVAARLSSCSHAKTRSGLEETYVADVPPLVAEETGPNPVDPGSDGA